MIEEKMLNLLRLGRISKWFSGIGQEAISTGCTLALESDEMIFPMHRNLGVFVNRGIPLWRLFNQWEGKPSGFTKGRDRSFHFGTKEYNIAGMISHLGPQLSLAAGVGLSHKINGQAKVSLAFTGEGGTSQGEFHEALNTAAVWSLPTIFIIENNGYGLSTPSSEQYVCENLVDRAKGYGMKGKVIDGNNVLEVYQTITKIASKMRKSPEPYLIECKTFRMRGHEEASGTKYVPQELMETWAEKDPIQNYEAWLIGEGVLSEDEVVAMKAANKTYIQDQLREAESYPDLEPELSLEKGDVYAPVQEEILEPEGEDREMRFVDAVKDGLSEAMMTHDNLVLMGQDIADYGGVFKVTDGLMGIYGKERVRNTPLCESAIIGMALGMSMKGMKTMVEMQFSDFVSCGFNQIVNNLAKIYYRWGQEADVVIRMPTGAGVGAGPFHSQSTEAWFTHVPGLKIVYPSTPAEAKGLLLRSFEDPNPVLFFEHKLLYRSVSGLVPEGYYTLPIGKARYVRRGDDVSIITYGLGVHWAERYCDEHDISADIVDLRTLNPLDYDVIEETTRNTGKVMVLHEDTLFGGLAGEIASWIGEHCFDCLDAPVMRCASLDTPVPFNKDLEKQFLASSRLPEKLQTLLDY
jgi:2-oxoisovalerate dehydrogenase E1 component